MSIGIVAQEEEIPRNPVRAEHAFPPTQAVYTPRQKTLPVGSHSSFRLKPSRSSGAPSAPGAFGAGRASRGTALRAVGLASLGQAELRGWLIRYLFECTALKLSK